MRPAIMLALLLGVGVPVRAADPAAELGARLSEQATAFLAQLLGPGRGRALVTVQIEKRETNTTRELSAPMPELTATGPDKKELPGYSEGELKAAGANAAAKAAVPFITTRDNVLATSDILIKKISVTVVLDKSVTQAQVAQVRELLPQFLQMDGDRGDDINIVMAPLRPAWKDAMEGPDGLRTLLLAGALLSCTLIIVFVAYVAVTRAVNVMSAELAARRPSQTAINLNSPWGALPGGGGGNLEGELLPGGLPSLTGEAMPGGMGGDNPALGRRFDFLTARKPEELARLLGAEAPEDLAQLFAYLATTNPDLASSLFGAIPPQSQSAVSQLLVTMSMADPERLASIESRLKTLAEYGVQGTDRLGKILSRLPAEQREGLIGEIVSSSPDAAAEIERSLFPFEDIATLKAPDLRRLLSSVPYEEWGIALRGASKEVSDVILKQLPAGARESVAEAMEQPSARARVQEARSKILSQLQALSTKGQIDLGRDAELI